MSFPNQDYLAMLKGKPPLYPLYNQPTNPYNYMNYLPQQQTQYYRYFIYIHILIHLMHIQTLYSSPFHSNPNQWNYMINPYMSYPYMMMPQMSQISQMSQMPQQHYQMPSMPFTPYTAPPIKVVPQIPEIIPTQNVLPHDTTKHVEVNGTKIWLNLNLIKQLPEPPEDASSVLDYDEHRKRTIQINKPIAKLEKTHFINFRRHNRLIKRAISTRNVKVVQEPEEIPIQRVWRKNDGYVRIGLEYQCVDQRRPINLSMMRMKLRNFKLWDRRNRQIYEKIQILLGVPDNKMVKVLNEFTNHSVLYSKLLNQCPITMQEVKNILAK